MIKLFEALRRVLTAEAQERVLDKQIQLARLTAAGEVPSWLLKSTQDLAVSLARRCYPEVPGFQVLDDLAGVISQIDNMTTGMVRKAEPV